MITLNEIVYNIRDLAYNGIASDDTIIPNRQIIKWINTERSKLIREYLNRYSVKPKSLVQDLGCLPLECKNIIECCELQHISVGEYVYCTEELPDFVTAEKTSLNTPEAIDFVGLIDGITPIEFTTQHISYYSRYKRYTFKERRAYLKNNRIYISNGDGLKFINVRGIFEDPTELVNYASGCTGESCYDIETSPYPILPQQESALFQIIMQKYLSYIQNPINNPDIQNDSNEEKDRES